MFKEAVTPAQAVEIAAHYWIPNLSRQDKIDRDWRLAASLDRLADEARKAGDHNRAKYLADRALAAANRAISY